MGALDMLDQGVQRLVKVRQRSQVVGIIKPPGFIIATNKFVAGLVYALRQPSRQLTTVVQDVQELF